MRCCPRESLPWPTWRRCPGASELPPLDALRLLCALGEPCVICDTTVTLACAGTQFTAKGQQLPWRWAGTVPCETFRGHLQARGIAGPAKRPPELPELREGQQLAVTAAVHAGQTAPPSRYTDAFLLRAMETAGAQEAGAAQGTGNPRHPCRNVGETGAVRIRGAPGKRPEHGAVAHRKQIISLLPETLLGPGDDGALGGETWANGAGRIHPRGFSGGHQGYAQGTDGYSARQTDAFQGNPTRGSLPLVRRRSCRNATRLLLRQPKLQICNLEGQSR